MAGQLLSYVAFPALVSILWQTRSNSVSIPGAVFDRTDRRPGTGRTPTRS